MSVQFSIRKLLTIINNFKPALEEANQGISMDGFVKIKNFLPQNAILDLFPNYTIPKDKYDKSRLLSKAYDFYSNNNLSKSVEVRGTNDGIDFGMIDLTSPEKLPIKNLLYMNKNSLIIDRIKEFIPKEYEFQYYSLYIYNNCNSPRCLHIDSIKAKHIKAFLYLTDSTYQDGLYCYVKGSHKNIIYNSIQYLLNILLGSDLGVGRTDGTIYTSLKATKFNAITGDLVITDQRGVHGDLPSESSGNGKIVLVFNFQKQQAKK